MRARAKMKLKLMDEALRPCPDRVLCSFFIAVRLLHLMALALGICSKNPREPVYLWPCQEDTDVFCQLVLGVILLITEGRFGKPSVTLIYLNTRLYIKL